MDCYFKLASNTTQAAAVRVLADFIFEFRNQVY